MSKHALRTYQNFDVTNIKPHLLIYGDLGGSCANCDEINVKLEHNLCPQCKTEFKYISFRNVKHHFPKIQKLFAQRPSMVIIDFEDYQKAAGSSKVDKLFGQ